MDILDSYLMRAHIAGVGIAFASAPLGCLMVWQRMAFFGDATAHAAILGVALALATQLPIFSGVLISVAAMAMILSALSRLGSQGDTLLAVIAHSTLAAGLVAVALIGDVRIDLLAFLFGDILAVRVSDIGVIWRWSAMITLIISPELAMTSGINPKREQFVMNLCLALTIAVAIKVVGALLIAALLVIPAASARPIASTPERMAIVAALISLCGVSIGLCGSLILDTPAGPSIVTSISAIFLLTMAFAKLRA